MEREGRVLRAASEARRLYRRGDYRDAHRHLTGVLAKVNQPIADEASVEAYLMLASLEVALGNPQAARTAAREVLARRPGLELSSAEISPKIIAVFDEARRAAAPAAAPATPPAAGAPADGGAGTP
jgi:hypothetical protein